MKFKVDKLRSNLLGSNKAGAFAPIEETNQEHMVTGDEIENTTPIRASDQNFD